MALTEHDKAEMQTAYRQAANPKKQIGILADLYCCSKQQVLDVLDIQKSSAAEQRPATGRATKSSPYSSKLRAEAVKAVLEEGITQVQAAERFGVNAKTLNYWIATERRHRDSAAPANAKPKHAAPDAVIEASQPRCLTAVDTIVESLHAAEQILADAGLLEESERDVLAAILRRTQVFCAGMRYAMEKGGDT